MCDECEDVSEALKKVDPLDTPFMDYFFCEPVTAGPLSAWCIRPRGHAGLKTSGGVDTASLCGRVEPARGGWDIELRVKLKDAQTPPQYVCKKCSAALRALITGPTNFSIDGHTKETK